jgi:thiamine kinase-like enzyme
MEYLCDSIPLYHYLSTQAYDKKLHIYNTILKHLKQLHAFHYDKYDENDSQDIRELLRKETIIKILERYEEIKTIVNQISIKSVNNVQLLDFTTIMEMIKTYIDKIDITTLSLVLIHGDLNFNNILINKYTEELCFIDPKGSFGNLDLYGLKQYDIAKIHFALSGYDMFDQMDITELDIVNEFRIYIPR